MRLIPQHRFGVLESTGRQARGELTKFSREKTRTLPLPRCILLPLCPLMYHRLLSGPRTHTDLILIHIIHLIDILIIFFPPLVLQELSYLRLGWHVVLCQYIVAIFLHEFFVPQVLPFRALRQSITILFQGKADIDTAHSVLNALADREVIPSFGFKPVDWHGLQHCREFRINRGFRVFSKTLRSEKSRHCQQMWNQY